MNKRSLRVQCGIVAVAVFVVTACGSGKHSSSTAAIGATSTTQPPGPPVKIGMVAPLSGPFTLTDMVDAAKAAVAAVNAAGGVKGSPIQLTVCDDKSEPNIGATCYRGFADDSSVVAIVGGASLETDGSKAVLDAAKIPVLGQGGFDAFNFLDSLAFQLSAGGAAYLAGEAAVAKGLGATTAALVRNDLKSADSFNSAITSIFQAGGGKITTTVAVAPTVTDLAAAAAQAMQGNPSAVIISVSLSQASSLIQALRQQGYKGTIVAGGSEWGPKAASDLGIDPGQLYITAPFPADASTPGGKLFNSDMDKYPGVVQRSSNAIESWLAVRVFAQVATGLSAVDRSSILAALQAATNVDTIGLSDKAIDWAGLPGPIKGVPRLPNDNFVALKVTATGIQWDGMYRHLLAG